MTRRLLSAALLAVALAAPLGAQIPQAEYQARRDSLIARLSDGVVLVLGGRAPARDYITFSQSSPFRYLTGHLEPDAALVVAKRGGQVTPWMFVLPRDPAVEVWTGARLGTEGTTRRTGLPARTTGELGHVLDSLLSGGGPLHVIGELSGREDAFPRTADDQLLDALKRRFPNVEVRDVAQAVNQLRGRKSEAELALIRKAVDITVDAQRAAMRLIEPGLNEFEVQALIEYIFRRNGAERPAFASIVGSGPNATALHYNADDRFMEAGDVVVMDVGASYGGYAADVTRTVPVSGTFTPAQRDIYQLVRDAQAAAERQAKIGAEARLMMDSAQAVIAAGLTRLGLIESPTATYDCSDDGNRQCPQWRLFFMHGLGHGIGLDVHDPEQYYYGGRILPGSAFSIEPGVYVRANLLDILPETPRNRQLAAKIRPAVTKYANIGVRIEDDYVVTPAGVEWISRAPREIAEIEAIMKEPYTGPGERNARRVEEYRKLQ